MDHYKIVSCACRNGTATPQTDGEGLFLTYLLAIKHKGSTKVYRGCTIKPYFEGFRLKLADRVKNHNCGRTRHTRKFGKTWEPVACIHGLPTVQQSLRLEKYLKNSKGGLLHNLARFRKAASLARQDCAELVVFEEAVMKYSDKK